VYCRAAVALAACLAALSVATGSDGGPERIAILRFENLSSDTSLDWMGRAFFGSDHTRVGGRSGNLRSSFREAAQPGLRP